MGQNQKWLVSLFQSITLVQWFFIITGGMTILFIKLMMDYYDKANQRNFKLEQRKREKSGTDIVKKP